MHYVIRQHPDETGIYAYELSTSKIFSTNSKFDDQNVLWAKSAREMIGKIKIAFPRLKKADDDIARSVMRFELGGKGKNLAVLTDGKK